MSLENEGRVFSVFPEILQEIVLTFQFPYVRKTSICFSIIEKLSSWKQPSCLFTHYVCISPNYWWFSE